ncbi:MAG TPA: hypothetical protein VMG98_11690 [Verrucomicrobiae bacterium]|nr:hypothetical protein [Verrucomicrobiae bacterium]
MRTLFRLIAGALMACLAAAPLGGFAQARYGQHDFDFNFGTWHVHGQRLEHPLTHSTQWVTYDGTETVRKVWGGRASAAEVDGPSHVELLHVRTYNPASRQWAITGASSADGTLSAPMYGDFSGGVGRFYDREVFNGRTITVRWIFSHIATGSYHFEQAFSNDGGATWQPNFIAQATRTSAVAPSEGANSVADTSHDFDFSYGTWATHIRSLRGSLWVDLTGTVTWRKIWNGRAFLEEISAGSGKTAFTGLTLFLYNPQARQWSQTYADSSDGAFNTPYIGGFHNGRGELIGPDTYHGKAVLMRDAWSDITPNAHHFEIGYSLDGGKTWHPIFVAKLVRTGPGL